MRHFLVLDNEPDHLELIRRSFDSMSGHYHLEIVETIREAKAAIRRRTPDLAIIDWRLSDGSGMELLPGYGRPAAFPIIVMTSYGNIEAGSDVFSRGAVDFVQKDVPSLQKLPGLCEHVLCFWTHLLRERNINATVIERAHRLSDLGMVAGGMVHDLNNKLTAIRRGSELVLEDLHSGNPDKDTTSLLETIRDSAIKSQALAKRILENSTHSHRSRVFDLLNFLESVSRTLRSIISGAVEIELEMHPTEQRNVNVDPLELELVVTNLVKNAEEAMGARPGVIRLEVDQVNIPDESVDASLPHGTYLRVRIHDNGQGIAKDKLPRIFDPFFTTKMNGTGLGLARAKGFFELASGDIIVGSRWGEGTTFSFFLPPSNSPVTETVTQPNLPLPVQGQSEHLVVVDDEECLLPGLTLRLERWNYRVTTFSDSEQALDFLLNNADQVHLVLTDFLMPSLTGLEVRRRLTASGVAMPRMILMTGRQDQMSAEQALRDGFDGFFEKPGDDSQLLSLLRNTLSPALFTR